MKDVMDIHGDNFNAPVPAKRIRRLVAVPREADLEDGLTRLRQNGAHVARTVDQDGNTVGLLFLEDVLEVLVGEVNDATAA
jgi:CBS domain containing-hemolysin-like protein